MQGGAAEGVSDVSSLLLSFSFSLSVPVTALTLPHCHAYPFAAAAPPLRPPPSLAGVAPDAEEWKKAEGLKCTDRNGFINDKGDPVCEGGDDAGFHSTSTTPPLVGTGPGQCDCLTFIYGGGYVEVGVCGGRDYHTAYVNLQYGIVDLYPDISHDGKNHGHPTLTYPPELSHNKAIFKPQPGKTVYFRVSCVEVGQFTAEMMVEGGPWGHLTPNGEPLLPKTAEGEAMEGMRVFVYLERGATVSDLRVGKQRKKPTKSANKRV
jgi:hypothetical protein